LLYQNQNLLLQNTTFSNHLWSDNSTRNQLLIDSTNAVLGSNLFWLSASDQYGCIVSDTILIDFSINTNNNFAELEGFDYAIFPNPSLGKVQLKTTNRQPVEFYLFNSDGNLIRQFQLSINQSVDLSDLTKGIYFISVNQEGTQQIKKLVLY